MGDCYPVSCTNFSKTRLLHILLHVSTFMNSSLLVAFAYSKSRTGFYPHHVSCTRNSGFCSMKWLQVLPLPLDRMLVYHR